MEEFAKSSSGYTEQVLRGEKRGHLLWPLETQITAAAA